MAIDPNTSPSEDRLALATAALRDTPILAGPSADLLARVEQIPTAPRRFRFIQSPIKLIAAGIAILFLSLAAVLLLQRSGEIAFADVVRTINQTHTFTAMFEADANGVPQQAKISVKDRNIRIEGADSISIINQTTGQSLQLQPSKHLAIGPANTARQPAEQQLDFYGAIRDYHTGKEKSLGEKKINGRTTQGFRTSADAFPGLVWILWVDPETKLPVQVEFGPVTMTDLHFDVPLDDSLFDTKVPAGYSTDDIGKADSWDGPPIKFAGHVIDERGKPIAGVMVGATCRIDTISPGGGYLLGDQPVTTDKDGRFAIEGTNRNGHSDDPIELDFRHADFLHGRLEDMRLIPPEQRINLQVRLRDGQSLAGNVVDSAGKPVAGALVEAIYGASAKDKPADWQVRWNYSKYSLTDADGKFEMHGLSAAKLILQVRKAGPGPTLLCGQENVDLGLPAKPGPVQIVARPLDMPQGTVVHELFGMKLVDVDDDWRARLSLSSYDTVMILDPGHDPARLGIGQLETGDVFWIVGETRVKNFDDFARQLLAECEAEQKKGRSDFWVRVVYDYTRLDGAGSNTQYMTLNMNDLTELRKSVQP